MALRGSDKAFVSTFGIWTLTGRERAVTRLGKGVDPSVPAISAVSPTGDRLAFLRSGLVGE